MPLPQPDGLGAADPPLSKFQQQQQQQQQPGGGGGVGMGAARASLLETGPSFCPLKCALDVALGMKYLHSHGMVHCDLKVCWWVYNRVYSHDSAQPASRVT
jgi:serine/threonine protein kinase